MLLALAGCGQQPAPAPAPAQPAPAAPAPAAPAPAPAAPAPAAEAKPPFKLGVILPYSGVYASLGESMTKAMELYFESVGYQAGGRPIIIIREDTEAKNDVGLRKTRMLVEQHQVDMLTGIVSSGVLLTVRDYVDESKVFLLVSNAGATQTSLDRKSPYIFRTSFTNTQPPSALGEWWYKNIAQEAFVIAPDYAAGYDSINGFRDTFEKAGGKIVGELLPPLGTTDYAPYLTQIRQANPGSVYAFFAGSDARNFVQQYEDYGLKGQIPLGAAGFMLEEDILAAVGEAALGHYSAMHWAYGLDIPENKAFIEAYEAKWNISPDVYAVAAYDTAKLIVEILNQLDGDLSDENAVRQAILNTPITGPRGTIQMDSEKHTVRQNMYIRQVELIDGRVTNKVLDFVPDWMHP